MDACPFPHEVFYSHGCYMLDPVMPFAWCVRETKQAWELWCLYFLTPRPHYKRVDTAMLRMNINCTKSRGTIEAQAICKYGTNQSWFLILMICQPTKIQPPHHTLIREVTPPLQLEQCTIVTLSIVWIFEWGRIFSNDKVLVNGCVARIHNPVCDHCPH